MELILTRVNCCRWPRLRCVFLRRFFLNATTLSARCWLRISAATEAPSTRGAPILPSVARTSEKLMDALASPGSLSTSTMSPGATRYCLPPVRITAYMGLSLQPKLNTAETSVRPGGAHYNHASSAVNRAQSCLCFVFQLRPAHG